MYCQKMVLCKLIQRLSCVRARARAKAGMVVIEKRQHHRVLCLRSLRASRSNSLLQQPMLVPHCVNIQRTVRFLK